jgi:hypothetical protein
MKPQTEQNIEKTLHLLNTIEGAQAPEGFSNEVFARLEAQKTNTTRIIPMRTVWSTAAAIALLLLLNVWVDMGYKKPQKQANTNVQQMASEMGLSQQGFWY